MDLSTLLDQIERNRDFYTLANTPAIQFGPTNRPLLGPTILPERTVDRNDWSEEAIRYKTLIANDGTRYSPPQKRPSGMITGSFLVSLGHQDVASELTSKEYDALLKYLQSNASMDAVSAMLQWVDNALVQPLVTLMEKHRWDAIVNASVVRLGDNGYAETVPYPNPSGARSVAGGQWSNNAYDPYLDIAAKVNYLYDKGYTANRFITSRKVSTILTRNTQMNERAGTIRVITASDVKIGRATVEDINRAFAADGLPEIEIYDRTYQDLAGTKRFLPDDAFVILSTTGNEESVALPNGEPRVIENTLGYSALGTAAGYATAGRQLFVEALRNKPPRVEGQAWQASLPVILEPEAVTVITGIS